MNAKQKLHQTRLNEWAAKFADQKASGLTVRLWCEQNNVSFHKYNYWKHQLKEKVVDQMMPDIVQLSMPAAPLSSPDNSLSGKSHLTGSDPSDCSLRTNRTNYSDSNIRLCIDGVALELDPSVSEDFLRTLIRAVHYA